MEVMKHQGIIHVLAELPPDAIIDEVALAEIFHRHPVSIRRAVGRGELPPPVRLFGQRTWTARAILSHLDERLEAARQNRERTAARISRLLA
jgi:hypothetical protein